MAYDIIKDIAPVFGVIVSIGLFVSFGTWVKISLTTLEQRVKLLEAQIDGVVKAEGDLKLMIVERLKEIEMTLKGISCLSDRDCTRR